MNKLINYFLIFMNWRLGFKKIKTLPQDISIELTNRCNFRCSYCINSDEVYLNAVKYQVIKLSNLEKILQKVRKAKIYTKIIHFTLGGEPFLYNNLPGACELAYKYGFRNITFASNASLFSLNKFNNFYTKPDLKYNIWIDFCSDEDYFESVRGYKGSWKSILQNINEITAKCESKNLVIHVTDISSFSNLNQAELELAFTALKNMFIHKKKIKFHRRVFHNATGFLQNLNKPIKEHVSICPHPWTSLVISSKGDIVACSRDIQGKTILGNVLEEDLLENFKSDKYINFQETHRSRSLESIEACKNCDLPTDKSKLKFSHLVYTFINRLGGL